MHSPGGYSACTGASILFDGTGLPTSQRQNTRLQGTGDWSSKPKQRRLVWKHSGFSRLCQRSSSSRHSHSWRYSSPVAADKPQKLLCNAQQFNQSAQTDLSCLQPHLQNEWHSARNLNFDSSRVNPFSFRQAVWCCPTCRHEWEERIIDRTSNRMGCPQCATAVMCAQSKLPFMSQWNYRANSVAGIQAEAVPVGSHRKVWWACHKCPQMWAHEFEASPYERSRRPYMCCPQCNNKKACICNDAPRKATG